jgi:hypothetical protein
LLAGRRYDYNSGNDAVKTISLAVLPGNFIFAQEKRAPLISVIKRHILALWLLFAAAAAAPPVFTNVFPPDEYKTRRARVMEQIGDAVAIMQGTTDRPGEQPLRQSNQFFYVTGMVEPRAIMVIDGKTKKSTLFLIFPKPAQRNARTAHVRPRSLSRR